MNALTQIGKEEFTEKVSHGFLDIYEELWDGRFDRDGTFTLLEIGVYNGNSMRVWDRWFHKASLIGIDKHSQPLRAQSRATLRYGDQADEDFLNEIGKEYGPFGIIIDDGGHHWDEQQISLVTLWDYLAPGGMYIIEDLHTSDDSWWQGKNTSIVDTVTYLTDRANSLAKGKANQDGIKSLQFFSKLAVIFKVEGNGGV